MLDVARRAAEISQGKKVGSLDPDSETTLALTRLLEILGEAAVRVTPELRGRHPEVPWRDIGDTRNRVMNEYFDVDMVIVETIVRDDLPALAKQPEVILKEMDGETRESANA